MENADVLQWQHSWNVPEATGKPVWLDPSEQGDEIGGDETEENNKGADIYFY